MPCCFPEKSKKLAPLYYSWSAAWKCYPKDNLLLRHDCYKPVIKKNFVLKNVEAIANFRKKFLEQAKRDDDEEGKKSPQRSRKYSNVKISKSFNELLISC